ncbi:MAG: hypothetical protein V3U87_11195 [Methylococcaceae bacterium]
MAFIKKIIIIIATSVLTAVLIHPQIAYSKDPNYYALGLQVEFSGNKQEALEQYTTAAQVNKPQVLLEPIDNRYRGKIDEKDFVKTILIPTALHYKKVYFDIRKFEYDSNDRGEFEEKEIYEKRMKKLNRDISLKKQKLQNDVDKILGIYDIVQNHYQITSKYDIDSHQFVEVYVYPFHSGLGILGGEEVNYEAYKKLNNTQKLPNETYYSFNGDDEERGKNILLKVNEKKYQVYALDGHVSSSMTGKKHPEYRIKNFVVTPEIAKKLKTNASIIVKIDLKSVYYDHRKERFTNFVKDYKVVFSGETINITISPN